MKKLYIRTFYFLSLALLIIYITASLMNFSTSSDNANFWPDKSYKFYKTHDIYRGIITEHIGNA